MANQPKVFPAGISTDIGVVSSKKYTTSAASGSTTTVVDCSTLPSGVYSLTSNIAGYNPGNVMEFCIVSFLVGSSYQITTLKDADTIAYSFSGSNLQVTQSIGTTQTVLTNLLRLM